LQLDKEENREEEVTMITKLVSNDNNSFKVPSYYIS
jgi:hypothetical protein